MLRFPQANASGGCQQNAEIPKGPNIRSPELFLAQAIWEISERDVLAVFNYSYACSFRPWCRRPYSPKHTMSIQETATMRLPVLRPIRLGVRSTMSANRLSRLAITSCSRRARHTKARCVRRGQATSSTANSPIVIDSYGEGTPPRIDGEGVMPAAIHLHNVECWEIRNLEITNHGETRRAGREAF